MQELHDRLVLVRRLIEELEREHADIENRIQDEKKKSRFRLNRKFFEVNLTPILEENKDGLTFTQIVHKLRGQKIQFSEPQLRTFLSRCKKMGLLEIRPTSSNRGRWKLPGS